MREFAAMVPVGGRLVRIHFDAADERDALNVAVACNGGLVPGDFEPRRDPVAYDLAQAQQLLGGLSRGTVFAWLAAGRLERVPGTRRVLITRSSLERAASQT